MRDWVQCSNTTLFQHTFLCVCMHVSGHMWEMGAKLPKTTFKGSQNDP